MTCSIRNWIAIPVIVFVVVACGGRSNNERYLESALDIIEENSIRSADINWQSIRQDAIGHAGEAPTLSGAHSAIRSVLMQLNDNHSHLLTPEDLASMESSASGFSNAGETPGPRSEILEEKIGYLWLPSFVGSSRERMTEYAASVQERIAAVDSDSFCGWIIDLRDNPGGNVWPMLAGIGPLMGEGNVSSFVYPDHATAGIWYRNGEAGILPRGTRGSRASVPQVRTSGEPYRLKNPNPAIAVLIGPRTASSGELVAISFIGRSNTATFGSETLGLTTNNDSFPLDDGAILVLATSVMADRTGRVYGDSIHPEIVIEAQPPGRSLSEQVVVTSASQWLRSQQPCDA